MSTFKDIENYAREHALPRVNINALARNFREFGFKRGEEDLLAPKRSWWDMVRGKKFEPTVVEAIEIYKKGKNERNALTSEVIDGLMDKAIAARDSRGPYGLVGHPIKFIAGGWEEEISKPLEVITWLSPPEPFRYLNTYMQRTLQVAYADEIYRLEILNMENPKDKQVKNYKRLKQWENFYNKFMADFPVIFSPVFTEASTGTATAAEVMSGLVGVTPQVCERDLSSGIINPDFLADVNKNSFSLAATMAMSGFDIGRALQDVVSGNAYREDISCYSRQQSVRGDRFDPVYFVTKKTKDGVRIDLNEGVWEEVKLLMAKREGTDQFYTTGCPAMAKIIEGKDSSVKRLWDWHVDISRIVYKDYWGVLYEPREIREARFQAIKTSIEERGLRAAGIHF